jgi:hypothetical protein
MNDVELFFNASNGGEITQYYDSSVDPSRSRNLVNIGWQPYFNLLPLFTSIFYNPYSNDIYTTGGDNSATLTLATNTSEYIILQAASRVISISGRVAKDVNGNVIYVNSTWIIHNSGLISVERTFCVGNHAAVPSGWRWYPFYFTRRAGFDYNGTFYMFNTTNTYESMVNQATYRNVFSKFSLLPNDTNHVFGIALPFSNTSIGGDGAHNMIIAYKYDELVKADQWRTDNYYSRSNGIIESGAIYEFNKVVNFSTHTYHMMVNFTHQPLDSRAVQDFAIYCTNNTSTMHLVETSLNTDKPVYTSGDSYTFYASGICHYNLTHVVARLTVRDGVGKVILVRNFGPGSLTEEQNFNATLLKGTVGSTSKKGNYTITFQIFLYSGIVVASDSKTISVT